MATPQEPKKKSSQIIHYLFGSLDFSLLALIILLSVVGIIFSYSAQLQIYEVRVNNYNKYIKQLIYFGLALGVVWTVSRFNYRKICEHAWLLYFGCVFILIYTLIWGSVVNNSKRWISLGFIQGQPSEFVKIVMILFVAKYLDRRRGRINEFKYFVSLISLIGLPILLILMQPDLGTALVFLPTIFFMLWVGGVDKKYLFPMILIISITAIYTVLHTYIKMTNVNTAFLSVIVSEQYYFSVAMFFMVFSALILFLNIRMNNLFLDQLSFYSFIIFVSLIITFIVVNYVLKDYQKERLVVFLNPMEYRWSLAYNIIQSQITIGSGGFWGKGLFQGTQSQLGFLPSSATDFIFSVIGEELGFVGTSGVLGLFLLFMLRLWMVARRVKDYLGGYIVSGIFVLFSLQIFINIGMTVSLLPITGIPLPFISAGGSTLVSCFFAIGVVLSVYSRRYVYNEAEK